jgi:hypothetical protein
MKFLGLFYKDSIYDIFKKINIDGKKLLEKL